jgi:hypothetical protein
MKPCVHFDCIHFKEIEDKPEAMGFTPDIYPRCVQCSHFLPFDLLWEKDREVENAS